MKKWSQITNKHLHTLTLSAAKLEKSATLDLLEYLAEIDRRRLYAEMGFPSLWIYVHEVLGYSESQTSERVSAMRLMVKVPEVKKELEAGNISLTTTAKLATHVRREKTSATETLNLLTSISGKTSREVEQHLAKHAVVEFKMDKMKTVTPETTRIIIDVDQEFIELLERVRELKGNLGSSTQELLKYSLKTIVKRYEVKNTESNIDQKESLRAHEVKNKSDSTSKSQLQSNQSKSNTQPGFDSRYIPASVKNAIRIRSKDQCEYIDQSSQKRCECKIRLEFDHIIPFSMGGQSTIENLRHYCSAHNKLSAIRQFGVSHMQQYLKN